MEAKQSDIATEAHGAAHAELPAAAHIVLAEDDDLFRESLSRNLLEAGFSVSDFGDGQSVLRYFSEGGGADLAVLDWKMPSISGIELMQRLKSAQVSVPVIFLTSLRDQIYEETALMSGAVDFVDKSRSFSILLSRIGLVVRRAKANNETVVSSAAPAIMRRGDLELHLNSNRAFWKHQRVDLTLAEFRIVYQLSLQTDNDLSHRQIYDIVRGPGFIAGEGENGYRANVRTFIKRIRRKFGEVDDKFDRIATYSGFGYRWASDADTPPVAATPVAASA